MKTDTRPMRRQKLSPLTLILLGKGRLRALKPIKCPPWRGAAGSEGSK
jgi:hypothetical protein